MRTKCEKYSSSDLMFYVRGKMSPEEELELQHHLLSCEECREELTRLRTVIESIEESDIIAATSPFKRIYIVVATATAIIIGGVFTIPLWDNNNTPSTPIIFTPAPEYNSVDEIEMKQDTIDRDTLRKELIEIKLNNNY